MDSLGRLESVKSLTDETNEADGYCLNEVVRTYNDLGMPDKEYQEHEGVKDSASLCIRYGYDSTAFGGEFTKAMRLVSMKYPSTEDNGNLWTRTGSEVDSRLAFYTYGSAGSIADKISRVAAIKDDDGNGGEGITLASYAYNGVGQLAVEDFEQPDVRLDYYNDYSGDPVAGTYENLDRFGRITRQIWRDYGASATRDSYAYTYDENSNRTSRDQETAGNSDEKYTYDDLDRLTEVERGTLSGGSITGRCFASRWTLSDTGNWNTYKIDCDGDGYDEEQGGDVTQNRDHNLANEIADTNSDGYGIEAVWGTAWADPVHDSRGNMTTVPRPGSMGSTYACVYDGFDRLVEVKDSSNNKVLKIEYDGLGRRTKKHINNCNPLDGSYDAWQHFYYDLAWQIVETRRTQDGENTHPETVQPEQQYVWSLRYIDAPVLRDANTDSDDLCDDQRLYYLTDANMNVTCVVDAAGDAVECYRYSPYGSVTVLAPDWETVPQTSCVDNLFAGYWRDAETGLYSVRFRYYHPQLGRWMQRDPLGYINGMSFYEYVATNPIVLFDPLGLQSFWGSSAGSIIGDEINVWYRRFRSCSAVPGQGWRWRLR